MPGRTDGGGGEKGGGRLVRDPRPMTVERAINLVDRNLIESADDCFVNKLTAEWWDDKRDEFALEFEESTPDEWPGIIARKREKLETWLANQVRERMQMTGEVPYRLRA